MITRWRNRLWYGPANGWTRLASWVLWPLAASYKLATIAHRWWLQQRLRRPACTQQAVLWVVGNLTVGGNGKTPLIIALVQAAQQAGWSVGVVSRGYGRHGTQPMLVQTDSHPHHVGDEPLLIARATGAPVVVGRNRMEAVIHLLACEPACQLVLSDDGLHALGPVADTIWILMDAQRGWGNGACLPAGPVRQPPAWLQQADAVVCVDGPKPAGSPASASTVLHGSRRLRYVQRVWPWAAQRTSVHAWSGTKVHAIAGIAHPDRFFTALQAAGLRVIEHAFPDHHAFQPDDLHLPGAHPVIMTEKDAVKVAHWPEPPQPERFWCVTMELVLCEDQAWAAYLPPLTDAGLRRMLSPAR